MTLRCVVCRTPCKRRESGILICDCCYNSAPPGYYSCAPDSELKEHLRAWVINETMYELELEFPQLVKPCS